MTSASQPQMSHADSHDLDKLARWKSGLDSAASSAEASFPACAIFLVGPEDRAAHDIFRRYRTVFEELGGGFHHLVIFGQHGVSTTQVAFLGELGASEQTVPFLAVATAAPDSGNIHCIPLPDGERDGDLDESQPWGDALVLIRRAAAEGCALGLDDSPAAEERVLPRGSLAETVGGILAQLSAGS